MKARLHKTFLVLTLGLSSSAMALSPIGPAQAVIGNDQWGVGINFGYQSMDLEADGTYFEYQSPTVKTDAKIELEDIQTTSSFVQIGLGLCKKWDVYGLVGVSNAEGDATINNSSSPAATNGFWDREKFDVNGDHEMAWGVGTRYTFHDHDTIKWGAVAQIIHHGPQGNSRWTANDPLSYTIDGTWEMEYWEFVLALGTTIVYDNVQFYGGPILHMVRGDMDFNGTYSVPGDTGSASTSQDLEEEAMVGGYAGMQMDLDENTLFYLDGQFTGKAWGVGVGTILRTH